MALIGRVSSRDHRPGSLDWSWRVGRSHCMSYSRSLLDTVTCRRGMGVGRWRLGTDGEERERTLSEEVNFKTALRGFVEEVST